jgi:hypothetical protein
MPYAIPDGGLVQLTFRGEVHGQEMLTVLHYQLDFPGGVTDGRNALEAMLLQVKAAGRLHDSFMGCMSQDYKTATIKAQWIIPQRYAPVDTIGNTTFGDIAQPCPSTNLACAITKRSENSGPHSRGTIHMPGIPSTFITDQELNGAGTVSYAGFRAELVNPLVTLGNGTYRSVIFRRGLPGASELVFNTVQRFPLRTMHRRTVGLGS